MHPDFADVIYSLQCVKLALRLSYRIGSFCELQGEERIAV